MLQCDFCAENSDQPNPAMWIAPQHMPGTNQPTTIALVCDDHFEGWFDDVPDEDFERLEALTRHLDPNCPECHGEGECHDRDS